MPSSDISSLIPIALALGLSLTTRNVIVGLFTGVFVGVLMLNGPNPFVGAGLMIKEHLIPELTDEYNAGVIILLAVIGGFVALMENSGGGTAFAASLNRWVKNRLQAQLATWFGGIAVFFSDLGTPLIVGPVFRPLLDRLKISRQKLAFIIDSTASPVAILIPFIGWGVYIMSLIFQEYEALGIEESEFTAFIRAIPFQFYAWLAVLMVPLMTLLRFDFGPMARAEFDAQRGDSRIEEQAQQGSDSEYRAFSHPNATPVLVWAPLLVLAVVLGIMLIPLGFPFAQVSGTEFRAGLSTAYLAAASLLIVLMAVLKVRKALSSVEVYLKGMTGMTLVAVTLLLAWALSDIGRMLGAAEYISAVAQAGLPYWLLPAVVFILSAVISFSTGSSWGTFAIMLPLVIPTAVAIDAPLHVCIGAVLSGGLFGDHSSPISETTILSSTGASCPQLEHFRTQLPYAVYNGVISLLAFVGAGVTGSSAIIVVALVAQFLGLILLRRALNARSTTSQSGLQAFSDVE